MDSEYRKHGLEHTDRVEGVAEARRAYDARAWSRAYELLRTRRPARAPTTSTGTPLRRCCWEGWRTTTPSGSAPTNNCSRRGDLLGAAAAAHWAGMQRVVAGDVAIGGGWLARAARLVEEDGTDSVPAGFLRISQAFETAAAGELELAAKICRRGGRRGPPHSGQRPDRARDCTSRVCSCSRPAGRPTAWRSSTRRWSNSPPARCRRWSPASSTAARSMVAGRCPNCGGAGAVDGGGWPSSSRRSA